MSEIIIIGSSDEHLADINPGFRKDNYRDSILEKLEYQGKLARKANADVVARAGDFIHVKPANKTTYGTMTKAAAIHRAYHCDTVAIPGNHDMSYNDPTTLGRQPLGFLMESGVFKPLHDREIIKGSLKARLIGVGYTTDLAVDGLQELVRKRPDDGYVVAFVHALASMDPGEKIQSFFNERIFDYRDLVFEGCPDAYVFGHYHKDQGIVDHMGIKFVNLGAVSRGALTFENLERKPKSSVIKINSQGLFVEEHVLPHKDASEVFDLERKKTLDKQKDNLSDFLAQLRTTTNLPAQEGVESRKAMMATFPDDLRDLITETMEAAEAGTLEEGLWFMITLPICLTPEDNPSSSVRRSISFGTF